MTKRIVYISIIHLKKKKQLQKQFRAKNHRQQGSSKTRRKNLRIGVNLASPDFLYVGGRVVYKRIAKYVKNVKNVVYETAFDKTLINYS
jgi:hypothetical protein